MKRSSSLGAVAGALLFGGVAGMFAPGCNDEGSSAGGTCISGQQTFCSCLGDDPAAPSGIQVCNAAGTFDLCQCAGTATDSAAGSATGSASASDSNSNGSSGGPDLCGNGFADPGECDPEGNGDICPQDCTVDDTTGDSGSTGAANVCNEMPIYVGMIPDSTSIWSYMDVLGFGAGRMMCQDLVGADDVCSYTELVAAEARGDFAAVGVGTTMWVHRVAATNHPISAAVVQPDIRSRCEDWTYATNHINDGEYVQIGAGGATTFVLDEDPASFPAGVMDCGNVLRAIPCCNTCED